MIDRSRSIDSELSNITGTIARANPKLKLKAAFIAIDLFPGGCRYFHLAIVYK